MSMLFVPIVLWSASALLHLKVHLYYVIHMIRLILTAILFKKLDQN